ncbi:putative protein tyrosine phosphatase [Microbacterium sp. 1154]|nr:putative protein tyrosine phosphatase [Microbacterium sp. 1154]
MPTCLGRGIPDDDGFMDADLVERLRKVVPRHLP